MPSKSAPLEIVQVLPPLHPGEVLREEFLRPLGLSPYAVAKAIGVPRTRIKRVTREEISVTADAALRLARFFGTTPQFWMGLQVQFDLASAETALALKLSEIQPHQSVRDPPFACPESNESEPISRRAQAINKAKPRT